MTVDIAAQLAAAKGEPSRVGRMAERLIGSEILKIADEIRGRVAQGADILNLTVGDFAPKQFPIPERLKKELSAALEHGHTNYPPSAGMPELRKAVKKLALERQGLDYPLDGVLIASGARPMIAGTFLTLVNAGDRVVYTLPSWNNNHYCTLVGAERVEVPTRRETGFFPTAADLAPHLEDARLVCINTPQNPTGTVMSPDDLGAVSRAIVAENQRRRAQGRPALYLMFDQVYWMLTFHGRVHANPVSLVPEIAPYTVFVDGISKCFAATGLRVGWALGPPDVMDRMGAILTHIGAWAPRAEQIATAKLLEDGAAMDGFLAGMQREVVDRLDRLARGIERLRAKGHDVDAIAPSGAIYLSIRVNIAGKTTPAGKQLRSDEDVRGYLLSEAGIAVVPFQAFGLREDTGWFRASVGAVSAADCERIESKLRSALEKLR